MFTSRYTVRSQKTKNPEISQLWKREMLLLLLLFSSSCIPRGRNAVLWRNRLMTVEYDKLRHFRHLSNGTQENKQVDRTRQGVTHPGFHCFGRNGRHGP